MKAFVLLVDLSDDLLVKLFQTFFGIVSYAFVVVIVHISRAEQP